MANRLPPLSWQTKLVNDDGTPTSFFILAWEILTTLRLSDLSDTSISVPTDGQVLTYSAAEGKWIPS